VCEEALKRVLLHCGAVLLIFLAGRFQGNKQVFLSIVRIER